MWFFADGARRVATGPALEALRAALDAAAAAAPGPARHGALGGALVRAGALAQGLADEVQAARGADDDVPAARAALHVTAALARALWASWQSGGAAAAPSPSILDALAAVDRAGAITLRRPEGFAYYAAYPEAWAAAAAPLAGTGAIVLGLRSIGTTLAAMVSAGAGLPPPLATLRPVGHPFRRTIAIAPALAAALAARSGGPAAVADEGPGLSGSSFGAALALLEAHGFAPERVHVFPAHAHEPGAEAGAALRGRYARAPRHVVPFEALFLSRDHPLALARLAEDVVGPAEAPPVDLSAGAWRRHALPGGAPWPPSQGWRERRKYLLPAGGATWIVRFAGLGEHGARAFERARALARAGLAAAPAALRHGFLWSRWIEGARPLWPDPPPRAFLAAALRQHLGFVAAHFPAEPEDGASPAELLEMARANAREALGPGAPASLALARRMLGEVTATARPVAVDGKVDAWEWLLTTEGRVLKADALDHHADHALPGCQDVLWDVAGVELAFDLAPHEGEALARSVRNASRGADPRLLPFYRACRAAFEVGRWTLAAADGGLDGAEAARRGRERERAVAALRRILAAS